MDNLETWAQEMFDRAQRARGPLAIEPFDVEYVGSLADMHGRYFASFSQEFRGRLTLWNTDGGFLRNVRPTSVISA